MAYNLRSRPAREVLLDNDEDDELLAGNISDVESDHVSEESDENSYEISSNESDFEDVHHEESANLARGRPNAKLRGKNNFVWNKNAPKRRSGMFKSFSYIARKVLQ